MTNTPSTNPFVYTTSGFLLPKTDLYDVYEKSIEPLQQLFSVNVIASSEMAISDFYKNNEVYTSLQANRLYMEYVKDPKNFDSFMALVNFATEIFASMTCREFFETQYSSMHISPMSLMLCKDILIKSLSNYQQYAVISPNTRFMIDNKMTATKANLLKRQVFTEVDAARYNLSWGKVLTPMIEAEGPFVTMFKHIFVDYY